MRFLLYIISGIRIVYSVVSTNRTIRCFPFLVGPHERGIQTGITEIVFPPVRVRFRFLSAERRPLNGEKALRRLPFCSAARNLSLFPFASVSTIPRGVCALPSAMAAVNTRPLNSAAAADKSEAAAGVL